MTMASSDSVSTASDVSFDVNGNLNFSIKVVLGSNENGEPQVRRLWLAHIVDEESGDVSLTKLLAWLKECTGSSIEAQAVFYYKDMDDDVVAVTTSKELVVAITQFLDKGCLRLVAALLPDSSDDGNMALEGRNDLAEDISVVTKLKQLMKPNSKDPVLCQKLLFDRGDVLMHLVDKFEDHVTSTFAPPCATVEPAEKPSGLKHWEYEIEGQKVRSKWFAVDNVYMDLREPCQAGHVRLIFPRDTYETLREAVDVPVIKGGFISLHLQEIMAEIVLERSSLTFLSLEEVDDGAQCNVVVKEELPLSEALYSSSHKQVYKMTGFCVMKLIEGDSAAKLGLAAALVYSSIDGGDSVFGRLGLPRTPKSTVVDEDESTVVGVAGRGNHTSTDTFGDYDEGGDY